MSIEYSTDEQYEEWSDSLDDDDWERLLELERAEEKMQQKDEIKSELSTTKSTVHEDELRNRRDSVFSNGSEFRPVTRQEIVGIDTILQKIDEIISWLRDPSLFSRYGARIEPGLLLEGSPGTGKTLCSRYIASSSDALFINVRDWPTAKEVVAAGDVADLFSRARVAYEKARRPVIVFWDEFEIYARERERQGISMRDASVVSQLTAELDGIAGKCPGVLFIGCTNYARLIDKALLRPGRMGLHISFVAPDKKGKAQLLKHYLSKFTVAPNVDYESGAFFFNEQDTAAAVEEGAHKIWMRVVGEAIRKGIDPVIEQTHINSVLLENLLGPPPPFMDLRPQDEYGVAVHELGHAIVAHSLGVPIQVITIQAGKDTFGRVMTQMLDAKTSTVDDTFNQICIGLGSLSAEIQAGIPNSCPQHSGQDVRNATKLAASLVDDIGLYSNGEWPGPMSIKGLSERNPYLSGAVSQELVRTYDKRIGEVMSRAQTTVNMIMETVGRQVIHELAQQLLKDKTWTGRQFDTILSEMYRTFGNRSLRSQDSQGTPARVVPLFKR